MAGIIRVDTDALICLAKEMQTANAQITDAVQQLNQTTTHDDWGCKERLTINQNILTYKKSAHFLQESSEAFTRAVTQAANAFAETEREIAADAGANDAFIGSIISVAPVISDSNITGQIMDALKDIIASLLHARTHTGTPVPILGEFKMSDFILRTVPCPLNIAIFSELLKEGG